MRDCSAAHALNNDAVAAINYCAQSSVCAITEVCKGICRDPDMSGLGVRYVDFDRRTWIGVSWTARNSHLYSNFYHQHRLGFYIQALTNGTHLRPSVCVIPLTQGEYGQYCWLCSLMISRTQHLVNDRPVSLSSRYWHSPYYHFFLGAWSGSVLTAALIIPALVQKFQHNITLHDATLVLK